MRRRKNTFNWLESFVQTVIFYFLCCRLSRDKEVNNAGEIINPYIILYDMLLTNSARLRPFVQVEYEKL